MMLLAPPRPPRPREQQDSVTGDTEAREALIEEARRRARRRRRRAGTAAALAALAAALVTGLGRGGSSGTPGAPPAPAARGGSALSAQPAGAPGGLITVTNDPVDGADSIDGIGSGGRARELWECPGKAFCGDLVGMAWSRDGRYLAITLMYFARQTRYAGMHIIDTVTGRDRHVIGDVHPVGPTAASRRASRNRQLDAQNRKYGCLVPGQLSWSPDGSMLAYACGLQRNHYLTSEVHVMRSDGSHPVLLRTQTDGAAWPSWSPDGARLAFSTADRPERHVQTDSRQRDRVVRSAIYTIDISGRHRQLVALGAAAPVWSPDGQRLAYRSACGRVRFVTPGGRDVTPGARQGNCPGIGPAGWPLWTAAGGALVIANKQRIYLIDGDGTHLRSIARTSDRDHLADEIRPAWQPG